MKVQPGSAVAIVQPMARSPGQPKVPDEIWERVKPYFDRINRNDVKRDKVMLRLGVSSSAVSQWLSEKNRPTMENIVLFLQMLNEDPTEIVPEFFHGHKGSGLPAEYGPFDCAALALSYERPERATAYIVAATKLKERPHSQYKGQPLNSETAARMIRLEVGEIRGEETSSSAEPDLRR